MNIASFIITFIVLWWIVFLIVLPFGLTVSKDHEIGHATSSPTNPYIFVKAIITTFITLIITYVITFHLQDKIAHILSN
jgi:predicted secreted protein